MPADFGKFLIGLGLFLALIGVLFVFRDQIPFLSRLGRLPGDFSIQREGFQIHFPLTTSILLSVFFSIVLWLFSKR